MIPNRQRKHWFSFKFSFLFTTIEKCKFICQFPTPVFPHWWTSPWDKVYTWGSSSFSSLHSFLAENLRLGGANSCPSHFTCTWKPNASVSSRLNEAKRTKKQRWDLEAIKSNMRHSLAAPWSVVQNSEQNWEQVWLVGADANQALWLNE